MTLPGDQYPSDANDPFSDADVQRAMEELQAGVTMLATTRQVVAALIEAGYDHPEVFAGLFDDDAPYGALEVPIARNLQQTTEVGQARPGRERLTRQRELTDQYSAIRYVQEIVMALSTPYEQTEDEWTDRKKRLQSEYLVDTLISDNTRDALMKTVADEMPGNNIDPIELHDMAYLSQAHEQWRKSHEFDERLPVIVDRLRQTQILAPLLTREPRLEAIVEPIAQLYLLHPDDRPFGLGIIEQGPLSGAMGAHISMATIEAVLLELEAQEAGDHQSV